MFINCDSKIQIYGESIDTVESFKYLGIEISNACINPEKNLEARIVKANSIY
jgi:hypothetical protein